MGIAVHELQLLPNSTWMQQVYLPDTGKLAHLNVPAH